MHKVVAVKQRYKLKSNSQRERVGNVTRNVVAVKQRYKLKSNSQPLAEKSLSTSGCCCKAKIQT